MITLKSPRKYKLLKINFVYFYFIFLEQKNNIYDKN